MICLKGAEPLNSIEKYQEQIFEDLKHTNEYGEEFWYARDLQQVLEYAEWRNFNWLLKKLKRPVK